MLTVIVLPLLISGVMLLVGIFQDWRKSGHPFN